VETKGVTVAQQELLSGDEGKIFFQAEAGGTEGETAIERKKRRGARRYSRAEAETLNTGGLERTFEKKRRPS